MFKKTIKYVDYNDVERTEDFYFNLTRIELIEMNVSAEGGLDAYINSIIQAQNGAEIVKVIKNLIFKAYGEKSLDGKYFNKSQEISERFSHTEAYDALFMELATNDKAAAEFINCIIPKQLKESVNNFDKSTDSPTLSLT